MVEDDGDERWIKVHYPSWRSTWDEWVAEPARVHKAANLEKLHLGIHRLHYGSTEGLQEVDGADAC